MTVYKLLKDNGLVLSRGLNNKDLEKKYKTSLIKEKETKEKIALTTDQQWVKIIEKLKKIKK